MITFTAQLVKIFKKNGGDMCSYKTPGMYGEKSFTFSQMAKILFKRCDKVGSGEEEMTSFLL
jgi:hypothetical protein